MKSQMRLTRTSGSVGGLGGRPPRSTRPLSGQVKVGNGNYDSVSITGNGNDQVKVGNGTGGYVPIMGNGNENVQTGNGTGQLKIMGRQGVRYEWHSVKRNTLGLKVLRTKTP